MSEYTLTVNGVEMPFRELTIETEPRDLTDPDSEEKIDIEVKEAVIETEKVGVLLSRLMLSEVDE